MKKHVLIEFVYEIFIALVCALAIVHSIGFVIWCFAWYAESYAAFKGAIG